MYSQSSASRTSSSKSSTATSRKHSATSSATKRRVVGTDAEKYVLQKKKVGAGSIKKSFSGPSPAAKGAAALKKSDFHYQHKEMKAQFAKTGKLSDLPSPQPSHDPNGVKCPHGSHMLHNKPKSTYATRAPHFWKYWK